MSDAKPRILVTGASGLLGGVICRQATENWSVTGVCHRHQVTAPGVTPVRVDLTDGVKVQGLMADRKPHAVIHAAAMAQLPMCERDPRTSEAVNVRVPETLASLCAQRGIPFVFTSTDLVFDGLHAPYDEERPATPVCVYGRHKAQAEKAVLENHPGALVARLPLMVGFSDDAPPTFTLQMLRSICQGRPVKLFVDEFRTPVDIQSAARGLLHLLGRARGILHLGGRRRLSRYDLGLMMAARLEMAPTMLEPVKIRSLALDVARSPDCSLDSSKAYGLGYDPASLEDAIQRIVEQFKASYI